MEHDDETTALLRQAADDFLRQEHSRERLREIDEVRFAVSREMWSRFAGQGWLSLRWPEALGGAGLGTDAAAALAEQFGRHLVPEPMVACAAMPGVLAAHLGGSDRLAWQALCEGCSSGVSLAALAWQDDAQSLQPGSAARAEPAGRGFRLYGRKYGAVGAAVADSLLVFATVDGEAALWQVPAHAEGLLLRTSVTSEGGTVSVADFDDVALPASALLARGEQVVAALERAVDEGLVLASAQLIGIAQAAIDMTLDYLRTRVQFGQHIGSFQAMQHGAVDVQMQLVLARAAQHTALQRLAAAPQARETRAAIAAAKARASEAALQAGRFGVQAHGAIGYAAESDIGLYLKAALRLAAYLGSPSQQRERHGQLSGLHRITA